MPPKPKSRPSMDGVHRPKKRMPDLRPDHDLPSPQQKTLLREDTVTDHKIAPLPVESATLPSPETSIPDAVPDKETTPINTPDVSDVASEPEPEPELGMPKKRHRVRNIIIGFILVIIVGGGVAAFSGYSWYQQQLAPASEDTSKRVRLTIVEGSTPSEIATQLEEAGVIKSRHAFTIYTKLSGTENSLKAGTFSLQPSLSTSAIVEHLVLGKQDTFRVTFLPGDTLKNNRQKLIDLGYSASEVDAALNTTYERELFAGKPAGTDLEGYIFGETYEFTADSTPESILNRTFDEFEASIDENNLVAGYKKQGYNLYQGITLASIIQKEVAGPDDSRQVAQVFFKRLREGMPLGADATFVYAAKKDGAQPTVNYDSPYNTRVNKGLPPGPISVPGIHALRAVANPAPGDYVYFVSGDDGKNYFSRTAAEHEENTRRYCIENCALF